MLYQQHLEEMTGVMQYPKMWLVFGVYMGRSAIKHNHDNMKELLFSHSMCK